MLRRKFESVDSGKKLGVYVNALVSCVAKLEHCCSYDMTSQFERYLKAYDDTLRAVEDSLEDLDVYVRDLKSKQKKNYIA
jgi:hypothetical protein